MKRIECPTCHQEVDANEPHTSGMKAERRVAIMTDQLRFAMSELERIKSPGPKGDPKLMAETALRQLEHWGARP